MSATPNHFTTSPIHNRGIQRTIKSGIAHSQLLGMTKRLRERWCFIGGVIRDPEVGASASAICVSFFPLNITNTILRDDSRISSTYTLPCPSEEY